MAKARANRGGRPVMLTGDAARRIGRVVQHVERGNRNTSAHVMRIVSDEGEPVRLCKTSAAWNKGTTATLNVWEGGTPPSETQSTGVTLTECVNKFANVATGKWVIVAKGGTGKYYLIAAEC